MSVPLFIVLLVLLLFCSCVGCLQEGVWTKYTADDVARWHAQAVQETAAPRPHPESVGFAEGAAPFYGHLSTCCR